MIWPLVVAGAFVGASPAMAHPARLCTTVTGTYAIYANNDFLHVAHSRHLIEVVSPKLDDELGRRGWKDWKAIGRFTLCGPPKSSALQWSVRNHVDLMSIGSIQFVRR